MQENLSDRARQLLKLLIERHISDGQPVGSRTLAESTELSISSATIRNIMADLEDHGYLHSPHTSAGRVPTAEGYRLFVNSLLTVKSLDEAVIQQVKRQIHPDKDKNSLLQSTSALLSSMTQLAGIVTMPKQEQQIIRHVEFLPLSGDRVLAILVLNEKEVQNRIIHTDKVYTPSELEQAANFLTHTFGGKDLMKVRNELLHSMQADRAEMNELMQTAIIVAEKAFQDGEKDNDYVLSGQANLLDLALDKDVDSIRPLFDAFTQKHQVLSLLDKCLSADGVQIFVGEDSGHDVFDGCSIITAPYKVDGQVVGALGVIGPNRMAYDQVIPIVDVTAKLLSSAMN